MNPNTDSVAAMSHGRIEGMFNALRMLLAFVFTLDTTFKSTILVLTCCVVAALTCYSVVVYQPFFNATVNRVQGACCAVFAWACVCLIMLEIRQDPAVRAPCLAMCEKPLRDGDPSLLL